ncbi:MAG: hypothetical protein LC676_16520 [Loktanella sp.]|nr:hypothetical protein [Loktanella sp.]
MKEKPGLTYAAFAKEVGLSRERIGQLVHDGMPTLPNGRIDPEEGRAWMADWLDPSRRKAAGKEGSKGGQVAQIRAASMMRDLRLKDLALSRAEGTLIDKAEAEKLIFERARFERDAWTGWATRTAATLASELGVDGEQMFAALDREVREHLADLASRRFTIGGGT